MHPNPIYRQSPEEKNLAFAASRGFGTLAVNGEAGPLLSHIPFRLQGKTAELHLVRSNPIARALKEPQAAVIAVTGAHTYISPDWYGLADQVPTWNYVAVHLRGTLMRLPDETLVPMLDRLSESFERLLAPKPVWLTEKLPEDVLTRLTRMILPCRLEVASVDGTWKLGQNKDEAARHAAADAAVKAGIGDGVAEIAALMRGVV